MMDYQSREGQPLPEAVGIGISIPLYIKRWLALRCREEFVMHVCIQAPA